MSTIRVDMTVSLDGYVTGPDDGPDAPMGVGGFRLFNWLDLRSEPGPNVPEEPPPGSVRFVTDVVECAALARTAVGDAVAGVVGAGAAQALLRAGEVDELELHVVPVLLGRGRRLFDHLSSEHVELELVQHVSTRHLADPGQHVLHLRYRVSRPGDTQPG